jgi:zinc transport system substrate-binding protein
MKYIIVFLFPFLLFAEKPLVLVTVAPYKYFVDKISQGEVDVQLLVPSGASSHTYEPTPKQIIKASKADIWFVIGEPFEAKAFPLFKKHNPKMMSADLREGVSLIKEVGCPHAGCIDPHFWLSPKVSKKQVEVIGNTLKKRYPEKASLFAKNQELLEKELEAIDQELEGKLKNLKNRYVMISHPAYAYLARDYGLIQIPIEFEGRDPTPKQLGRILDSAKKAEVHTLFTQPQYSDKGAQLIAKEMSAKVVSLDPYAENYPKMMSEIGDAFSKKDLLNDASH